MQSSRIVVIPLLGEEPPTCWQDVEDTLPTAGGLPNLVGRDTADGAVVHLGQSGVRQNALEPVLVELGPGDVCLVFGGVQLPLEFHVVPGVGTHGAAELEGLLQGDGETRLALRKRARGSG